MTLIYCHDESFVKIWTETLINAEKEKLEWIEKLREQGIKVAHPDDGWVDREKNEIILVYPQFDDGVIDGCLMALGWPWKYRIVKVISHRIGLFGNLVYWRFENL